MFGQVPLLAAPPCGGGPLGRAPGLPAPGLLGPGAGLAGGVGLAGVVVVVVLGVVVDPVWVAAIAVPPPARTTAVAVSARADLGSFTGCLLS